MAQRRVPAFYTDDQRRVRGPIRPVTGIRRGPFRDPPFTVQRLREFQARVGPMRRPKGYRVLVFKGKRVHEISGPFGHPFRTLEGARAIRDKERKDPAVTGTLIFANPIAGALLTAAKGLGRLRQIPQTLKTGFQTGRIQTLVKQAQSNDPVERAVAKQVLKSELRGSGLFEAIQEEGGFERRIQ